MDNQSGSECPRRRRLRYTASLFYFIYGCCFEREEKDFFLNFVVVWTRSRKEREKKQKTKKSARSCSYLVDPWSCSPTRISYRLLVPRYSSSVVPNWFPRVPFGCVLPLNSFQTCSSSLFLSQLLILWNLSLSLSASLSLLLSLSLSLLMYAYLRSTFLS